MSREIKSEKSPKALGPYSQAVEVNGVLYVSGAIGIDPVTGEVADGIEAQAEQALKNLGGLLGDAGYDYTNVVKSTCFLSEITDFAKFNEVYAKYFNEGVKPARSCVAVKDIPKGCLCEIEVIAVK